MNFPIDAVRKRLPAVDHHAFFDAPGGTQVCAPAIERMVTHLSAGGNLIVTRLDHDANVAPWRAVAADRDMEVRWLDFDPNNGRLRFDALSDLLDARTQLVAVGAASNALGTVNDVAAITAIVRARSAALVYVDAVQSVPHLATAVTALGCDMLACSPYKFFGPHQGVLWGRAELLEQVKAYKVRPVADRGRAPLRDGYAVVRGPSGRARHDRLSRVARAGDRSGRQTAAARACSRR